MPSTYTTRLGVEKPATGEQTGTWGTTVNNNFDLFDEAVSGQVDINLAAPGTSGSPVDLPVTEGLSSNGRNMYVRFTSSGGDLGADSYVQLTPNSAERIMFVKNELLGSRSLHLFQGTWSSARELVIPNGRAAIVRFNGGGTSNAYCINIFDALYVDGFIETDSGIKVGGSGSISVDTIVESDTDAGVTIDGVLHKDNAITMTGNLNAAKAYLNGGTGGSLFAQNNNSNLRMLGGQDLTTQSYIDIYGKSHISTPWDIRFHDGRANNSCAWWNSLNGEWDYNAKPFVDVGGISLTANSEISLESSGTLKVSCGTDGDTLLNVRLATNSFQVRNGTTVLFEVDDSFDQVDAGAFDIFTTGDAYSGAVNLYERASAPTFAGGVGNIWLKNNNPPELWFQDDLGGDYVLWKYGSFTPALRDDSNSDAEGQTYSSRSGYYWITGNVLHFKIIVAMSSIGTLSGNLRIAALPYSAEDNGHCVSAFAASMNLIAGASVSGTIGSGTSYINLYSWDSANGVTGLTTSEVTGSFTLYLMGSYVVNTASL